MEKDLYAILGVEKSADVKVIKQNFLKRIKQKHPDKISGSDNSVPNSEEVIYLIHTQSILSL